MPIMRITNLEALTVDEQTTIAEMNAIVNRTVHRELADRIEMLFHSSPLPRIQERSPNQVIRPHTVTFVRVKKGAGNLGRYVFESIEINYPQ